MCFSAEADIVAGLVVSAIGVGTIRHVGHDREAALASLPLLFGIHQLIEVAVWWGTEGRVPSHLFETATWLYLLIAFGLVPWWVPHAVRAVETDAVRTRWMAWLLAAGVVASVGLTVPVVVGPVSAIDGGAHLAYSVPLVAGGALTLLYVVATCGSLLLSSDRVVTWYGVVNLVVVAGLAVLLTSGVVSLWCVWAAVSSIAIAIHLGRLHRTHTAPVAGV